MTYSKPLSTSCTEIAADWYFLVRDVNILHEDIGGKLAAKGIVCIATLGIQAAPLAAAQLEKVRKHCLAVEKQMYAIQRKIKSLAINIDAMTDELAAAQTRLYDERHTIPATLAGEDLDMTLSMFATQIFVIDDKNPSVQIARSYEAICLRAYWLPCDETSHKEQSHQPNSYRQAASSSANEPKKGFWLRTGGAAAGGYFGNLLIGAALAVPTGGVSVAVSIYSCAATTFLAVGAAVARETEISKKSK